MLIYIPTLGRPQRQITFNTLPRRFQRRVMFVVRREEEPEMIKRYGHLCRGVLVQEGKGVAAARQTAFDNDDGFDCLAFLDDDLRFSVRVKNWDYEKNNRALKMSEFDIEAGLLWLQHKVDTEQVACAGLGARGGNNGIRKRWENENYRIMRSFAVRRDVMEQHNIQFDSFYYWEDFHVALSLLELGHKNVVSVNWLTDGITNATGGVVRNIPKMWDDARRFVKLHTAAQIVEKTFKHGDRKEADVVYPDLRVAWKKAFNSGAK